jgi:hypothetical protein
MLNKIICFKEEDHRGKGLFCHTTSHYKQDRIAHVNFDHSAKVAVVRFLHKKTYSLFPLFILYSGKNLLCLAHNQGMERYAPSS